MESDLQDLLESADSGLEDLVDAYLQVEGIYRNVALAEPRVLQRSTTAGMQPRAVVSGSATA